MELLSYTRRLLQPTWNWLMRIVDSCEAQLRYGQALALHTTTTHPDHPNHKNESKLAKKSTDKSNKDELNNVDSMIKQVRSISNSTQIILISSRTSSLIFYH